MKREEVIEIILNTLNKNDAVISTTGLISREIYDKFDTYRNFYIPGSMGLVSSVGLGVALASPQKRIIIIDGDASLLMNLGTLVTIGHRQPTNLLHFVIDNGAYGSCSEEDSMSDTAHIDLLANNSGYLFVRNVSSASSLKNAIIQFKKGPGLILIKIDLGGRRDFQRPVNLPEIKERFISFLNKKEKII